MFLPVPADTSPPPECMAAGTWGRDVETKQRDCDCVRATVWRKEKKKKGEVSVGVRREEEVILWATAFRMTGLSWEISVKRARELFSCFPLFRDISCGILLFSVTELCLLGFSCQQDLQAVPERLTVYLASSFVIYLKGTLTCSVTLYELSVTKMENLFKIQMFLGG